MRTALFLILAVLALCAVVMAVLAKHRRDQQELEKHLAYAKAGESRTPSPEMNEDEAFELWQFRAERLQRGSSIKQLDTSYRAAKRRIRQLERHLQRRLPIADYVRPQFSQQQGARNKAQWFLVSVLPELHLSDYLESRQELYELGIWLEIIEEIIGEHISPTTSPAHDDLSTYINDDLLK